jgi:serine/threonine protein kinase
VSEGTTCVQCATPLDSRSTFCPTCGTTVPDRNLGATLASRYVAERRIAIGGFGSIYRGHEISTGRAVALKIMHPELAGDENLIGRFRREGLVLLKLVDPHAVATYELGETADGLPFIAMELLAGETLLQAFRGAGRLPWRRALAIGRGVCGALVEAHALGIIHRDLKPANIFLAANDFVKVLDFGIAKILASSEVSDPRELTRMGTAVGTVEYMAPEQLMGGKADPRTDLYTLGVVMYETITGRRPFNAAGLDLLTEQLTSAPPPPSAVVAEIPPDVEALLLRCLAADIDGRFATAKDLARAIDAALAAHPEPIAAPQVAVATSHVGSAASHVGSAASHVGEPHVAAGAGRPTSPPARAVFRARRRDDRQSIRWVRLALVAALVVAAVVATLVLVR